jgi:hypothetical protein
MPPADSAGAAEAASAYALNGSNPSLYRASVLAIEAFTTRHRMGEHGMVQCLCGEAVWRLSRCHAHLKHIHTISTIHQPTHAHPHSHTDTTTHSSSSRSSKRPPIPVCAAAATVAATAGAVTTGAAATATAAAAAAAAAAVSTLKPGPRFDAVVFAGRFGVAGTTGDGGQATDALVNNPFGVVRGPDRAIYFCEYDGECVRRVGLDGVISTVAGCGRTGGAGDGGSALDAEFNKPHEIRFGEKSVLLWSTILLACLSNLSSSVGC